MGQQCTNQDNKGPPCLRGGCCTRRLTPRGIVPAGICDIKLFNHRTIEKAWVPTVARVVVSFVCVAVCTSVPA